MGNSKLNSNNLYEYDDLLSSWNNYLKEDGDILLYGCNVGAGASGKEFVESFSQYTTADISASTDLTGSPDLGGDWDLEYATGDIEAGLGFDAGIEDSYQHTLVGGGFTADIYFNNSINNFLNTNFPETTSRDLNFNLNTDYYSPNFSELNNPLNIDLERYTFNNSFYNSVLFDFEPSQINFNAADFDFNSVDINRNSISFEFAEELDFTPAVEAIDSLEFSFDDYEFDFESMFSFEADSITFKESKIVFEHDSSSLDFSGAELFKANANLFDYKFLDSKISWTESDISFADFNASDFRALDYAFPGDELFDGEYYFATNIIPEDMNPFTDYIENGYQAGRNPNGLFDVDHYLNTNIDVKNYGMEPLKHYALFGYSEDFNSRDPNPLFDSSYYNAKNPDVVAAGMNPLLHYMEFGWKESRIDNPDGYNPNRDPNPFFDTEFYFNRHTDVLNASYTLNSANPVQHMLEFGFTEDRVTYQIQQSDKVGKITRRFTPDSDPQEISNLQNNLRNDGYDLKIVDKSFEIRQITPVDDPDTVAAAPLVIPLAVGTAITFVILGGITFEAFNRLNSSDSDADELFGDSGFSSNFDSPTITGYTVDLGKTSSADISISYADPSLSDLLKIRPFPGQTENQIAVEIFTAPEIDGVEDFTILPEDTGIFLPTTGFPQGDETLEAILNGGLFLGGEENPQGAYVLAAGGVTVIGTPDLPEELPQGIRLGQLEGGGTIKFLGDKSQGIEGYFTPSGGTEEKPFSLKASNNVGRKANLIQIINRNGVQIQRAGITDPVLLRIESKQFGAEELKNFIEGGIIERIPTEGIFEKIYFDAADGTVVVDSTGTSITK